MRKREENCRVVHLWEVLNSENMFTFLNLSTHVVELGL